MPSIESAPVEIDFERYFSLESKHRVRSALKELKPYSEIPGMISFGAGIPSASTFPVSSMTLSVPFAGKSIFVPGVGARTPEDMLPLAEYVAPGKNEIALLPDLAQELSYSATYGTKHFLAWQKEHIQRVHAPKYSKWGNLCTAGNTDGMDAVMRATLDRGDHFLVEEFAYPGLLAPAESLGFKPIGVPMDLEGVDPIALDQIMAEWDESKMGGPRPKLIVIVPTCSNPGGVTVPEARKREIYSICRKWDLLIVEDDPYCFLQIRENGADSPIVPSFISMDIEGRVIRVDSFSKVIAPGSRLGFITAHEVILEKIMNTRESATQCPSGFSIAAITAVLRAWGGHEGFERRYVPMLANVYKERALHFIKSLQTHCPLSTIEIPQPSGGMFLWVRLKIESHPKINSLSPDEISQRVFDTFIQEKILTTPGRYFRSPRVEAMTREEEVGKTFIRLSYALPSFEELEEGAKRMGRALRQEWEL